MTTPRRFSPWPAAAAVCSCWDKREPRVTNMTRTLGWLVTAMLFCSDGAGAARAGYVVTDLGTLGGGSSYGFGINESGQVTGYSSTAGGTQRAFLYDGTTMHDLGTLGGNSSYGWGINDAGQVTGYSSTAEGWPGIPHAFLYDGTTMHDLGTLGGSSSYGYGINNAGQVTGYSYTAGGT